MRLGITLSIGLHTLVILITWFGFPHLRRDPPLLDQIIFVKVADVAEVTNLPPLSENKKPVPKDKTQPKPPKNIKSRKSNNDHLVKNCVPGREQLGTFCSICQALVLERTCWQDMTMILHYFVWIS